MKLSGEQKDLLRATVETDGWSIVTAVISHLVSERADSMIKYDLSRGDRGLVVLKAELEGAKRLQHDLLRNIETLTKQKA